MGQGCLNFFSDDFGKECRRDTEEAMYFSGLGTDIICHFEFVDSESKVSLFLH